MNAKTYRLPDWLGGHECTLIDVDKTGATVTVEAEGGGTRTLKGIWVRALDLDWLDAYQAEALERMQMEFRTPPLPRHDLGWMYRVPMNITPPTFPHITGA